MFKNEKLNELCSTNYISISVNTIPMLMTLTACTKFTALIIGQSLSCVHFEESTQLLGNVNIRIFI